MKKIETIKVKNGYIKIDLINRPKENDWNYSKLSGDIGRLANIGVGNKNLYKIVFASKGTNILIGG
jgi:hypothetical protein